MTTVDSITQGGRYEPTFYLPTPSGRLNNLLRGGGVQSNAIVQYQSKDEGSFKCHPKGTKVIMFDGTFKDVSEIEVGDRLMGPNSTARTVLGTGTGEEMCYKIKPTKGESWECNESHLLELVESRSGEKTTISLKDYLLQNSKYKQHNLLFRSDAIEFGHKPLNIDPYFLGLWLGDGTTSEKTIKITNADEEVIEWLKEHGKKIGVEVNAYKRKTQGKAYSISITNATSGFQKVKRTTKDGTVYTYKSMQQASKETGHSTASISRWCRDICKPRNGDTWEKVGKIKLGTSLSRYFQEYELIGNKHIPHIYKTSSIEQRLNLLAGFIDSDGTLANNGSGFTISQSNKELAEEVAFVARSLGFAGYINEYTNKEYNTPFWHISIFGNGIENVPTKISRKKANPRKQVKDPLRTGFKVEKTGIKKYYGFTLDKDQLYLLKDFTVTHNTTIALQMAVEAQKQGHNVGFIDAEMSMDSLWAEEIGVDTSKWFYTQPTTGEKAWQSVYEMIREHDCKVVVLDSLDSMQPELLYENELGDAQIGGHAKLHSKGVRKVLPMLAEHNAIIIAINQKRVNLTQMGARGYNAGAGKAWGFYSKLIIDCKRGSANSNKGNDIIDIDLYVEKNKLGKSFVTIPVKCKQGIGIMWQYDRVEELLESGDLVKNKSWYRYKGEPVAQGDQILDWVENYES